MKKVIFLHQVKHYIKKGNYIVAIEMNNGTVYDLTDVRIINLPFYSEEQPVTREQLDSYRFIPSERIIPQTWQKN